MNNRFGDWARVIAAACMLVSQTGCGAKASRGGAGSDTSWLERCSTDDDCREGSCHCRVCTRDCSRDSQCADLTDDASCITTRGLSACDGREVSAPEMICSSSWLTARLQAESLGDDGPAASESEEASGESPPPADKVDLLFVVDNSIGMRPSQELLTESIPEFLHRFISPRCVDRDGATVSHPDSAEEDCPDGAQREFSPIEDVHVGVITTSLGGYGSSQDCIYSGGNPGSEQKVDMAHLMGSLPRAESSGADFVRWTAGSSESEFSSAVAAQVLASGELGCGWEASLESWYRFLVEPFPYRTLVRTNCPSGGDTNESCIGPSTNSQEEALVDDTILEQRRQFLRPDSMLGIVMLSNENDCSFKANGQSWRLATAYLNEFTLSPAFRGSAACEESPNDRCCHSCGQEAPAECPESSDGVPVGCEERSYDTALDSGSELDDAINLRCFQQKRRFGVDYLYPVERYARALTETKICPSSDSLDPNDCSEEELVRNPLFGDLSFAERLASDPKAKRAPARPKSHVFLSGILGVPWQDLAEEPSPSAELVYRSSAADESKSRINWDWLIGERNSESGIPAPKDPLMRESIEARNGTNPATGEELASANSKLMANPINGHEWNIQEKSDLQFACITPLVLPKECPSIEADLEEDALLPPCECTDFGGDAHQSPLCQTPEGYGLTQGYSPAYPSLRQLQVLHDLGDRAVPASICAKEVTAREAADFAYKPALNALADRMKPLFPKE